MKKVAKFFMYIGVFIGLILVLIGYFIILSKVIEATLPKGWYFYEPTKHIFYLITMIFLAENLASFFKKNIFRIFAKKSKIISVALLILCSYIFVTNIVVFTEDKVIVKSTFNPKGKEYSYKDVEKVNAHFSKGGIIERLLNSKYKGNFLYDITLDGKVYTLSQPSVNTNSKYSEDKAYIELEDLDKKLVEMKVKKESSDQYYENNTLDQEYRDRFMRIINNK